MVLRGQLSPEVLQDYSDVRVIALRWGEALLEERLAGLGTHYVAAAGAVFSSQGTVPLCSGARDRQHSPRHPQFGHWVVVNAGATAPCSLPSLGRGHLHHTACGIIMRLIPASSPGGTAL